MDNSTALTIIKSIVKKEYLSFYDDWPTAATAEEKKGLAALAAIMKHKGGKRFRKKPKPTDDGEFLLQPDTEKFTKKNFMSSYALSFGRSSGKESQDIQILKFKKLSELPCSKVLQPVAIVFAENWIAKGDSDYYQSIVLKCVRSLYSLVKLQDVPKSAAQTHFCWIDTKIHAQKRMDKKCITAPVPVRTYQAKVQARPKPPPTNVLADAGKSYLNPSAVKAALMKGNGNITASCFTRQLKSSYQSTFVTPPAAEQIPKPKIDMFSSSAVGGISPDPILMGKMMQKNKKLVEDLKRMTHGLIDY